MESPAKEQPLHSVNKRSIPNLLKSFVGSEEFPLFLVICPILLIAIIEPNSFSFFWFWGEQIGRAGFLLLPFLAVWDWYDSKPVLRPSKNKVRYAAILIGLGFVAIYFWLRTNKALTDQLRQNVIAIGASEKAPLSFLLAVDFLVYALYTAFAVGLLYGGRSVPLILTPVIYAVGTATLDFMDAFYPEDSLAFLQVWVYVIWNVVIFILNVLGFHQIDPSFAGGITRPGVFLTGNTLGLWGYKGFVVIKIFWPSSGVVSMLIYSLVIAVLMVKLQAPRSRKLFYAAIGAFGTYLVNVTRITLIVLYLTYISLDVQAFHDAIGEVLFIIWIVVFLVVVVRRENSMTATAVPSAGIRLPFPWARRSSRTD